VIAVILLAGDWLAEHARSFQPSDAPLISSASIDVIRWCCRGTCSGVDGRFETELEGEVLHSIRVVAARRPSPSYNSSVPAPNIDGMVEDVYAELRRLADRYVRRERAKSVQPPSRSRSLPSARETRPSAGRTGRTIAIAAISAAAVARRARASTRRVQARRRPCPVTLDEGLRRRRRPPRSRSDCARSGPHALAIDESQAKIVEPLLRRLVYRRDRRSAVHSLATVKRHWTIAKAGSCELEGKG
jgi:hypothetical protein